jgi:hypothetical protein
MSDDDQLREQAKQHLEARRNFGTHLAGAVVLNVVLIGIWALTGAGYFWPMWVIFFSALGLAGEAWSVFFQRGVTEADIDREVERRRGSSSS